MPAMLKLYSLDEAAILAEKMRQAGKRIVMTNGCFDLLHPGHIIHLQQARDLGDALFVALNSDSSVRELKGPNRPIYPEMQRAIALSSLTCVDAVVIFDTNPLRIMRLLHPDIYAKGGDYTLDTLDKEERQLLESQGTRIHILPQIGDLSTTKLIERLRWNH